MKKEFLTKSKLMDMWMTPVDGSYCVTRFCQMMTVKLSWCGVSKLCTVVMHAGTTAYDIPLPTLRILTKMVVQGNDMEFNFVFTRTEREHHACYGVPYVVTRRYYSPR